MEAKLIIIGILKNYKVVLSPNVKNQNFIKYITLGPFKNVLYSIIISFGSRCSLIDKQRKVNFHDF